MLVDSWWLVDLWCLVDLLYDNSNFEMPRQKQLIANTDGGKTLGNDNEDHVLTCFQGLHLSNMLMNKILQWFRQYKIPWVGEFQTFPLYRVPNGRCFGWFWDVRDRSLIRWFDQWHSECVLEDSCSLHSLYLYIHIHTCFTYCLYLNRNKYTWYWNRQKHGKLNFIVPWEDQVQRPTCRGLRLCSVLGSIRMMALQAFGTPGPHKSWKQRGPDGMGRKTHGNDRVEFFVCTLQKNSGSERQGAWKFNVWLVTTWLGCRLLQFSTFELLWIMVTSPKRILSQNRKLWKLQGSTQKLAEPDLAKQIFFCAACSCGWIRNQPRWVRGILHPWITPGSSRHGCSVWETSPGSRRFFWEEMFFLPFDPLVPCSTKLFFSIRFIKSIWSTSCSPPVRWGLLDFMSVSSPALLLLLLLPRPPPVAILWVQCGVPDPNRDPASSVWRAGPQPRSCEFSVACRTPTAILRVQCGVPDPNRDPANSVWRPGPQPRSCEFSVASRTPTAILWVQCGVPDLKYCVKRYVRKNVKRYVRKNIRKYVRNICQKECQKICQKECQKDMSERYVRKNVRKICQKECQKICQKEW